MDRCPSCGSECHAENPTCPNCQAPLAAELPAQPAAPAGLLSAPPATLGQGVELGCRAARLLLHTKGLLILVLLLTTLGYFARLAHSWVALAPYRAQIESAQSVNLPQTIELSAGEKWLAKMRATPIPAYLLQGFDRPMSRPGEALSMVLGIPVFALAGVNSTQGAIDWPLILWTTLAVPLIYPLVYLLLLGWLFAAVRQSKPARWRDYLKAHYRPLMLFLLVVALATVLIGYLFEAVLRAGAPSKTTEMLLAIQPILNDWLLRIVLFGVFLVPFAIVGRRLGLGGGLRAAWNLLWRNKWPLLAVFALYRAIYELVYLASLTLPSDRAVFNLTPAAIAGNLLVALLMALLGLWTAGVFALVVDEGHAKLAPTALKQPLAESAQLSS